MEGTPRRRCAGCGTSIIVIPWNFVVMTAGHTEDTGSLASHLDVLEARAAATGDRLALADDELRYTCPGCGRPATE
jgi:hypothetical protein